MIYVVDGNDFLVKDFVDDVIAKKFKDISDDERRANTLRNPQSIAILTEVSAFSTCGRVIIWHAEEFQKLKEFIPYSISKKIDLIIVGELDKRKKDLISSLKTFGAVFKTFKDLYPNQVESWILAKVKTLKLDIDITAVKMLAFLYGSNIGELKECLVKLKELNKKITVEEVRNIGYLANKFSIFELQDKIIVKDIGKSLYVLKKLLKDGEPHLGLIRFLMKFFSNLLIVRLGDEDLLEELKLHSFVIKKLKSVRMSNEGVLNSLDILKECEKKLFWSFSQDLLLEKAIFRIIKQS